MTKTSKNYFGFTPPLHAESGFTLIEFLLGFLIFSIILVVLYSTFFSGMKIEERSLGDAATYSQVKMSLDIMGRELERAVHFDFSSFSPEMKSFTGNKNKISFLIPAKDGVRRVTYYLKNKEKVKIHKILIGGHYKKNVSVTNITVKEEDVVCLMRSEEAFADFVAEGASSTAAEEVLFDNVWRDSFKISYAYLDDKGEKPKLVWKNAWDKDYIPCGIRFEMTLVPFRQGEPIMNVKKDVYVPTGFWGELL
ncbi:MAG: prepilin-type N-terminal cleavage/methylation domain-containing protein [Candidatus Omnitrophica bacterium]|nr:prepilin-type N-terminal cleavage/methylation domain-containing protein [Candidatus Omnitrophota bacterium]